MLGVDCEGCGKNLPLAETAMVKERYLCKDCTIKAVEANEATWEDVARNVDATVCFNCKKDNGDTKFELVAGLGACPECTAWMRNRPFPNWVKMALAGMVAFALAATVWNWRFVDAYLDMKASHAAMAQMDTERAVSLVESALRSVPESKSTQLLVHYYKGLDFLLRDKGAEAYAEFEVCCRAYPNEQMFKKGLARAALSKAFEEKDFDEYMRLTTSQAASLDESDAAAMLASAYACKYAQTHDEQYKTKALECMAKAKEKWGKSSETFEAYEDRMMHRIETGQIIKRAEFKERYPKGYKASKEKPQ